jgi:hypothetical protein
MYRSALEHLLHEQGFSKGMLAQKLEALDKQLAENRAPTWAYQIDPEILQYFKDIGNGAIHTNDGDLSFQDEISPEALAMLELAFTELLAKVYEEPAKRAATKARMQELAEKAKPKPSTGAAHSPQQGATSETATSDKGTMIRGS